ncbi:MAG: hypothetical protein C5B46_05740 [Proteobacteria bacterium]|nr:MAG: hypothetical protein C5B46_05740 [Pseudomonadota bacterium]
MDSPRRNAIAQIELIRTGRVGVITLKRREHGNRIGEQMAKEAVTAFESVRKDPALRACVVTGDGDIFCLGGDYESAGSSTPRRTSYAQALSDLDRAMSQLGKPLIAAVNGDAHAGGFALVIACDLAVMATEATLGLPEAMKGLFPFIALAIVRDVVPKKLFFDLVYNARLMRAEEAQAAYLVNEVVPRSSVRERAIELAERASTYNSEVVRLGRDLYYGLRGTEPGEALTRSRSALLAALAAKDRATGPS